VIWILGDNDDPNSMDDQNLSPGERRRRTRRARYAEMSPVAKEALLKRARDARAAKRLFKTPQEKENARLSKGNYKKKMKEHRANTLDLDSIAMANPQWNPGLLFPPCDKPSSIVSKEMVIPDFGGSPVYVDAEVREPSQQDETPETFPSNTIHTTHLTPGLRESRQKRHNQEFESTIGRNTNWSTGENENITSQPTQSCAVDNGKLLANLYYIYYIIGGKLITKMCFNVVYIKVSRKPTLWLTEQRKLVMKGVLKHNHPWLMSLILCHHVICTDTLVKVCVYGAHALLIHIVHIHLCSSDHSNHMWLFRW
jgi:hypothetical protein